MKNADKIKDSNGWSEPLLANPIPGVTGYPLDAPPPQRMTKKRKSTSKTGNTRKRRSADKKLVSSNTTLIVGMNDGDCKSGPVLRLKPSRQKSTSLSSSEESDENLTEEKNKNEKILDSQTPLPPINIKLTPKKKDNGKNGNDNTTFNNGNGNETKKEGNLKITLKLGKPYSPPKESPQTSNVRSTLDTKKKNLFKTIRFTQSSYNELVAKKENQNSDDKPPNRRQQHSKESVEKALKDNVNLKLENTPKPPKKKAKVHVYVYKVLIYICLIIK